MEEGEPAWLEGLGLFKLLLIHRSDRIAHQSCFLCMQVDLLYFPFMERFALAMPEFTGYDPCDACDGVMSAWLEAMMQLTSCQLASPDAKLFQQAIRYTPS